MTLAELELYRLPSLEQRAEIAERIDRACYELQKKGHSLMEIANALGVSESRVQQRLQRYKRNRR